MPDQDNRQELETTKSRREFLKKAGKYAVYTPPAVMLLMKPSQATFCRSGCGDKYSWMKSSGGLKHSGGYRFRGWLKSSGGMKNSGGNRGSYMRMMARRWRD